VDVKNYSNEGHELPFLDSGVHCELVASALTATGTGKPAANFLVRVCPDQDACDSTTRTKGPVGGKMGLFQQSLSTESSAAICLNTMRAFGWKGDDLNDLNLPPAQSGMTEKVAISSEMNTYEGKTRCRVKYVNKIDLSLSADGIAGLNSQFAKLIADSKKGPLQVKKAAAAGAQSASSGSSGSIAPPARDMGGSVGGAVAASDEVPF